MKEVLWSRKTVCLSSTETVDVEYYLLIEELQLGGTFYCETYGVKLCLYDGKDEKTSVIHGISPNAKKIEQLLDLLSQNLVTPSSLSDVMEDWLVSST